MFDGAPHPTHTLIMNSARKIRRPIDDDSASPDDSVVLPVKPVKPVKPVPEWVHPFERAGLGLAPFRCVGYTKAVFQAFPGAPIQAGSSCDYCATSIMHTYQIVSVDNRTFKVGCDCVLKTSKTKEEWEAWRASLREMRRSEEYKERIKACKAAEESRRDAIARERAERAAWNAEDPAVQEIVEKAAQVTDSVNASEWEKKGARSIYIELTEGHRSNVTDREAQMLSIAYPAALLPVSQHIGKPGDRLRGITARYEGGPTIGIDSMYGPSVLGKFRVTEGPQAGAVLIWKTKYHPAARGAIVSLTGTVDKEVPHSEYAGVKQTKVSRCKVEVLDESGVVHVRD